MPVLRRTACKTGPPSCTHCHIPGNTVTSVCSSQVKNGRYSAACRRVVGFPDPTTSVEELLGNPEERVAADRHQAVAERQHRHPQVEDSQDSRRPAAEQHQDRHPVVTEGQRWRSSSSSLLPLPVGPERLPLFPGDASPRPLSRSPNPAALAPTPPAVLRV